MRVDRVTVRTAQQRSLLVVRASSEPVTSSQAAAPAQQTDDGSSKLRVTPFGAGKVRMSFYDDGERQMAGTSRDEGRTCPHCNAADCRPRTPVLCLPACRRCSGAEAPAQLLDSKVRGQVGPRSSLTQMPRQCAGFTRLKPGCALAHPYRDSPFVVGNNRGGGFVGDRDRVRLHQIVSSY